MIKFFGIVVILLTLNACSYSDGDRVGQVIKLSRKGYIFKTYEGELATLAKGQQATMISNSFLFTVKDEDIAKQIQQAMDSGKIISLHYEQEFFVFPWEGNTSYFITKVSIHQ